MPTLLNQTEVKLEWADINNRRVRAKPRQASTRSSGVHVSGVIKYVLMTSGMLNVEDTGDEFPLRMAIGMAAEEWFVGLWPKMKWQPGEVTLDGISGSPDGITGKVLEEFKCTWKSAYTRPDILKERLWMWQLMSYLKMLKLKQARLHVVWINGDYRPPSPKYAVYNIGFTQAELDRHWEMVMLRNKDKATPEKH